MSPTSKHPGRVHWSFHQQFTDLRGADQESFLGYPEVSFAASRARCWNDPKKALLYRVSFEET